MVRDIACYDKSDQHQTIDDSHGAEVAWTQVQSLTLENTSSTYSLTGGLEYDVDNEDDKHWLYTMFLGYWCGDNWSAAPLAEYAKNEIFQELSKERNYFTNTTKNYTLTWEEAKATQTS